MLLIDGADVFDVVVDVVDVVYVVDIDVEIDVDVDNHFEYS